AATSRRKRSTGTPASNSPDSRYRETWCSSTTCPAMRWARCLVENCARPLTREGDGWLDDKAALITGGSSGIGLAVARALGEDGYGITIAARRPDKLEQAAAQLRDEGLDVLHVAANMAEEDDIRRMNEAHR